MKKQTKRREEAFKLYRKLGSVSAVSREPGMPRTPTLFRWKQEDKWDERNKEITLQVRKYCEVLEKAKNDVKVMEDLRELEFLKMIEAIVAEKIISGDIQPRTWNDVISTIKFVNEQRRLITGRPTIRSEVKLNFEKLTDEELDTELRTAFKLLSER